MLYFDNASTTEVDPRYRELILNNLFNTYGNPGSIHHFGMKSKEILDSARLQVAIALNAKPDNVVFTSSGSEANTLAILGMAEHLKKYKLNHIITSKYEHHSVLNAMKEMERQGFDVTYLDVPNGLVNYDDFVAAVRDDTGFVSIMYINNELGTKNDLSRIYEFCRHREIIFHSDCVQAVGSAVVKLGVTADMITISGHKIHAPKGVGCLCTLYKDFLTNVICGGQQEFGLRPGTENVAFIAAFGQAMYNITRELSTINYKVKLASMAFGGRLVRGCTENDIQFACNTSSPSNTDKIISVRFDGIDAETLVIMLGERGLCVSSGAACSSHSSEPSHVLKAIGLTDEEARSTIRVSFSDYNTVKEAYEAVEILIDCLKLLKNIGEVDG